MATIVRSTVVATYHPPAVIMGIGSSLAPPATWANVRSMPSSVKSMWRFIASTPMTNARKYAIFSEVDVGVHNFNANSSFGILPIRRINSTSFWESWRHVARRNHSKACLLCTRCTVDASWSKAVMILGGGSAENIHQARHFHGSPVYFACSQRVSEPTGLGEVFGIWQMSGAWMEWRWHAAHCCLQTCRSRHQVCTGHAEAMIAEWVSIWSYLRTPCWHVWTAPPPSMNSCKPVTNDFVMTKLLLWSNICFGFIIWCWIYTYYSFPSGTEYSRELHNQWAPSNRAFNNAPFTIIWSTPGNIYSHRQAICYLE